MAAASSGTIPDGWGSVVVAEPRSPRRKRGEGREDFWKGAAVRRKRGARRRRGEDAGWLLASSGTREIPDGWGSVLTAEPRGVRGGSAAKDGRIFWKGADVTEKARGKQKKEENAGSVRLDKLFVLSILWLRLR